MGIVEIEKTGNVTRVWVEVPAISALNEGAATDEAEATIGERSSEVVAHRVESMYEVIFVA